VKITFKPSPLFLKIVYPLISKFYYSMPYFKGSTRIFRSLFNFLPLYTGTAKSALGFTWYLHSRESLWTYLMSCEKLTTKNLIRELHNAEAFICVGANFGWYPLVAASINPTLKVFGFECNSEVQNTFKRNVTLNNYQVTIADFAISDHEGKLNLYMPIVGNDGMSTLHPIHGVGSDVRFVEEVLCTTLDIYFRNSFSELGKTVILMDIEGSEMTALLGAAKLLAELNPVLICEINPAMIAASGHNYLDLFANLASAGYRAFWIDERGPLTEVLDPNELPHTLVLPIGTGANYLFKKVIEV